AGATPSSIQDRIYGDSIRPSRLTPFLVTAALAAVLLFVIAQVFSPVLRSLGGADSTIADSDSQDKPSAESQTSIQSSESQSVGNEPQTDAQDPSEVADDTSVKSEVKVQAPEVSVAGDNPQTTSDVAASRVKSQEADGQATSADAEENSTSPAPPTESMAKSTTEESNTTSESDKPSEAASTIAPVEDSVASSESGKPMESALDGSESSVAADTSDIAKPFVETPTPPPTLPVAKVGSEGWLIHLAGEAGWQLTEPEYSVPVNTLVAVAPYHSGSLLLSKPLMEVTIEGSAGAAFVESAPGEIGFDLGFGTAKIKSVKESTFALQLGPNPFELVFDEGGGAVEVSLEYSREPGSDPMDRELVQPRIVIRDQEGKVDVKNEGDTFSLEPGLELVYRGKSASGKALSEVLPVANEDDLKRGDELDPELIKSIRESLEPLIRGQTPVAIALHEALLFRRAEVAAAAAETLLSMGQSDAYFGPQGMFSQPQQRQYWQRHFKTLREHIYRSPKAASMVFAGIAQMNAANAGILEELLIGYDNKDLEAGADQRLVSYLDHPTMSVRVLAIENLRDITGTTMYYRAEFDKAERREDEVRKWKVRADRGNIQYAEDSQE
ncbi:MAG: hypothetical protein AAF664_09465, partial [Planctomycetota bacterium]